MWGLTKSLLNIENEPVRKDRIPLIIFFPTVVYEDKIR